MNALRHRLQSRLIALAGPGRTDLVRKGAWAFADQALISLTNFLTTVLLARVLSPRDFGLYALFLTALLFLNNVQSALVSQPQTMLGAPLSGAAFVRFTTETAWSQIALSSLGTAAFAFAGVTGLVFGWSAALPLLACAAATAAWQMQEYLRRILYVRSRVAAAFLNDLVSYLGQLVLIVLLWQTQNLTTATAIVAISVTSLLGAVIGAWQARGYLEGRPSWAALRETVLANWHFGKWLLGGHIATWSSGRLYPLLAAGLISITATGAMKAVQTILGPMNVLTFAIDPLFGPMAARANANGGTRALRTMIGRVQMFMIVTVGVYCLIVSIWAVPILRFVYADQYTDYAWLLVIMAINYAFIAIRSPMALALTVLRKTSIVFRIHLISSSVNLTLGIAAVYLWRLPGIGIGILLNCIVLQVITWHFYLRFTEGHSPFRRAVTRANGSMTLAREPLPRTSARMAPAQFDPKD